MNEDTLRFELLDDGTMDTVIQVSCTVCGRTWVERFDGEYAFEYRDEDGYLDLPAFVDEFDIYCTHEE